MVKESNMAIFSLFLGFIVVFCNVSAMLADIYLIIITAVGTFLSIVALILSINNKKKIRSKRDKYIFAIIMSIIALVFNLFLFVSLILFSIVKHSLIC